MQFRSTSLSYGRERARRRIVPAMLATVLAMLCLAAVPGVANAADPTTVKVHTDGPAKFWTGTVRADGPATPAVPECQAVHCDKLNLVVSLPYGIWHRPGGVQVAIRWEGATEGALGLYVYR